MMEDSEVLHEIANISNQERVVDIVFVHGLGGRSHSTWRHGKKGKPDHFFWPEELGKALPHCGIWSIGYPAGFTNLGQQGMIIEKRAGNIADKLTNAGLGNRPIIFVTHSMGGLVVKHLIVDSPLSPGDDRKRIVGCIKGVVFCGTPHKGSGFADAATVFGVLGGGSQKHVKEMQGNEEKLDFMHGKFIEWHRHNPILIDSYAENRKLSLTRWLLFSTNHGVVVPRASANPGIAGCEIHDSDDDHLTLVKPRDSQHMVYAGVLRFIEKALKTQVSSAQQVPVVPLTQDYTDKSESIPIDLSRIDRHAPAKLIGRETELLRLDEAWNDPAQNVLIIRGIGGEGKTSLVVDWASRLAQRDYDGAAYFDWSFYSQGTRDQTTASSGPFIVAALEFFGGEEGKQLAKSESANTYKASKLLEYICQQRTLLILDGLEPLQFPPGPLTGQLRDDAMALLLKGLAQKNPGLCIVTTRESITDLSRFQESTAPEWELEHLSDAAGSALLQSLLEPNKPKKTHKVISKDHERIEIVRAVKGHALTLRLLGGYIHKALRDVRRWREVDYSEADKQYKTNPKDTNARYGHAFKTIEAYEKWFASNGQEGERQLAVLRILGLFDRPASNSNLVALRAKPFISGLTEPLANITGDEWNIVISELEDCGLVTHMSMNTDTTTLDAHPLLREYFAKRLREQHVEAWRAGHQRLYKYLCESTKEGEKPTLAELQPLYQAVVHGCLAGLQEEVCDEVYLDRILRGNEFYSWKTLGAQSSDLGAIACFFDTPWHRISLELSQSRQSWLLNEAALRLRALGRLGMALEPMLTGLKMGIKQKNWASAAISAGNLSELKLTLGELDAARSHAEQSVSFAEQSGDEFQMITTRTAHADALFQLGQLDEAKVRFTEAEAIETERQPNYPLLYSLEGFRYCDLLLADPERAVWAAVCGGNTQQTVAIDGKDDAISAHAQTGDVAERAAKTLLWAVQKNLSLLSIALDHLALGRTTLYKELLEKTPPSTTCQKSIEQAVDGLRRAGTMDHLPKGLLTNAILQTQQNNPKLAQADLNEALEIAERGPMPLFLADIYLHRARLFFRESPYPWHNPDNSPRTAKQDLAEARRLIEKHGYLRRKQELEDAEQVIGK